MNYVFKNGSSLVMSEHPALSTYRGQGGTSPPRGRKQCSQLGPGVEPHKHITWFMLHLKTQKSALRPSVSASRQGKEWEDPHWEVWQLPQGEHSPVPPSLTRAGSQGPRRGWGKGRETHAIWFCPPALFSPHHFSFPVITLDFRILCLLQKLCFQPSITLKKGI